MESDKVQTKKFTQITFSNEIGKNQTENTANFWQLTFSMESSKKQTMKLIKLTKDLSFSSLFGFAPLFSRYYQDNDLKRKPGREVERLPPSYNIKLSKITLRLPRCLVRYFDVYDY